MSNKTFFLSLLALYSSLISACEPEEQMEQRELTVWSLGGSQVVYPAGSTLNLPGEVFNGHELLKANLESKSSLYEFFAEIADKFGFKHRHPLEFKFASGGGGKFSCVNSQVLTIQTGEEGIILEISGFGRFYSPDFSKRGKPILSFPLFRFDLAIPAVHAVQIMLEIDQGMSLEEYDELVRKYTAAYNPRPYSGFPNILSLIDCDDNRGDNFAPGDTAGNFAEPTRFDAESSVYDSVNNLLEELEERVFTKGSEDCLLSYINSKHTSRLKMFKRPNPQGSIMRFLKSFISGQYFPRIEFSSNTRRLINTATQQILSIKLSDQGRLVEVFCPVQEAWLSFQSECVVLKIDSDSYMSVTPRDLLLLCDGGDLQRNTSNLHGFMPLRENYDSEELLIGVEEGEKRDKIFKMLEYARPYIGQDKPPVPLIRFTGALVPQKRYSFQ